MGSHISVRIRANETSQETIEKIKDICKDFNALDCWNRWSSLSKWWPDSLVVALTKAFPKVMFRIDVKGDYNFTDFHMGDKSVAEHWCLPVFPSVSKFNSGIKNCKRYQDQEEDKKRKAIQEKVELVKKAQEIEERKQYEALKAKYG